MVPPLKILELNPTINATGYEVDLVTFTLNTNGAPVVTTNSTSTLTADSATLNGAVNPEGQSTSYYFDWGTSTAYGSSTSTQSAGNDNNDHSETANLSNLQPGTTYHYRLVATNSNGTTYGTDHSFTTLSNPPPPASSPPGSLSTSPSVSYKPGDVNHDGKVDIYDLSILLPHYGKSYPNAQFTGHSTVTLFDLSFLLSHYGE